MNKTKLLTGGSVSAVVVAEARAARAKQEEMFGSQPIPQANERYTHTEYVDATVSRMTGPRSQRPTFRAIMKTIRRHRRGLPLLGSWRSWPAL